MQQAHLFIAFILVASTFACGSPDSATREVEEGTPNVGVEASGQPEASASKTGAPNATALPSLPGSPSTSKGDLEELVRQKAEAARKAEERQSKRSALDNDAALAPAKELARKVAATIITQDVKGARKLFLPSSLIDQIFPGEACAKERASGEKERLRMERKLPGILRRGARFLIYGPDNLDGAVEPAQEAKVKLSLGDVTIRRSKTLPKGKTSKRGCTMSETLVGTKVRLNLVASMGTKKVDVPINIQVLKVGEKGWYLAEL